MQKNAVIFRPTYPCAETEGKWYWKSKNFAIQKKQCVDMVIFLFLICDQAVLTAEL